MEIESNKEFPSKNDRAPILETKISKSKDGRWLIYRTIITDIKPVKYFEKVLSSSPQQSGHER